MGSKLKETFVDPISRRDFLKKTSKGIMGAAAATTLPGDTGDTGGITEIVKGELNPNAPYNYGPIIDMIKSKGIFSSSGGYDTYQLGKFEYEEYNPSYGEPIGETPRGTGKLTVTETGAGGATGPDGETEYYDYEIPSYEINFNPEEFGEPTDFEGPDSKVDYTPESIEFIKDFYFSSPEDLEADFYDTLGPGEIPKEDAKIFDEYLKDLVNIPPQRGSLEFEDNQRKIENQKTITKNKRLPVKKEGFNLTGLIKSLPRRLPAAKVINVLQLLSQGLDLYEALNETMGMPSKEEFEQIVKDMEDSGTYANGGLASIGV
jgi:hypothetical protein